MDDDEPLEKTKERYFLLEQGRYPCISPIASTVASIAGMQPSIQAPGSKIPLEAFFNISRKLLFCHNRPVFFSHKISKTISIVTKMLHQGQPDETYPPFMDTLTVS